MYLIYTTFSSLETARPIVHQLLHESLIACANLFPPHTAIYRWEGEIQEEQEVVAILKTPHYDLLAKRLQELHPYTCPCIVGLKVNGVNEKFEKWIESQTLL